MTRAPGRGQLRNNQAAVRTKPLTARTLGFFDRAEPSPVAEGLFPYVRAAIAEARDYEYADQYQSTIRSWLLGILPPLVSLSDESSGIAYRLEGEATAAASLYGRMLGGGILKQAVNNGLISPEACLENIRRHDVSGKGLVYNDSEADAITLSMAFGDRTGAAFKKLENPIVRTMSAAITGLAVFPPK